jgi:1-aminocyclopropane-1-carboxylate deaminase/D-cysteine desulfhydrase-like pyridoxal-dependent ACC family enzyme
MSGRFPLAVLPTPLSPAPRLAHALGCGELWVKRDDLTGFIVAGNKARKLERLVAAALAAGADTLVTGGGPASNFCAAAAAAARLAGLRCLLVLYGDPADADHANFALAQWHGAEVRFTSDHDRSSVDAALEQVAAQVRTSGARPYVVPRGGASVDGAAAYADAGAELADQMDATGVRPATVLVAAGSGGTAAGLVADAAAARRPWRVVAAAVSRPTQETASRVLQLAQGVAERLSLRPAAPSDVDVRDARGPGYGIPSDDGERATRLAAQTEGLLLDPVFTAKTLGLLMAAPELPAPVVFWHTGGQVAALAHLVGLSREAMAR